MHNTVEQAPADSVTSIILENISIAFSGKRRIFAPVTATITQQQRVAIIGNNGAGKSTFLKILLGLLRPSSGSVTYIKNLLPLTQTDFRNSVGFTAPYLALYEEFTPAELVYFDSNVRALPNIQEARESFHLLLEQFTIAHRKNDYIKSFSSGMKQRVRLALALYHAPEWIILDEPTSNLDAHAISTLFMLLERYSQDNHGIIIATNEAADSEFCPFHVQITTI